MYYMRRVVDAASLVLINGDLAVRQALSSALARLGSQWVLQPHLNLGEAVRSAPKLVLVGDSTASRSIIGCVRESRFRCPDVPVGSLRRVDARSQRSKLTVREVE